MGKRNAVRKVVLSFLGGRAVNNDQKQIELPLPNGKTWIVHWDGHRLSAFEKTPWPRFYGCLFAALATFLLWWGIFKLGALFVRAFKRWLLLLPLVFLPGRVVADPFGPVNDGGIHGTNCPGPNTAPVPIVVKK